MLTKNNVTIGIEWRFGADWPGQRCGAKTRKGTECQRPANKRNGVAGSMEVPAQVQGPMKDVPESLTPTCVTGDIPRTS
jgi:hypothetical protein